MEKLSETPKLGAHWNAMKEIPISRELFDFELAFAEVLAKRKGLPILEIINGYTWMLKNSLFPYDREKGKRVQSEFLLQKMNDLAGFAHQEHINLIDDYSVDYKRSWESGARFGCVYYDRLDTSAQSVGIHFSNAEYLEESPLSVQHIESRKIEMKDMLTDIHTRFSDTQEVCGKSWLYNLPAYRQFFPQSYLANLAIDYDESQWGRGSTIWGQFVDHKMQLKAEKAYGVLEAIKAQGKDEPLSSLYKIDGLLLPPLATHGPISDFYEMYDVKI